MSHVRARRHGRSMEAEVRDILQSVVSPAGRVKLGSVLAEMGWRAKLTENEFAVFEAQPAEAAGISVTNPWQA